MPSMRGNIRSDLCVQEGTLAAQEAQGQKFCTDLVLHAAGAVMNDASNRLKAFAVDFQKLVGQQKIRGCKAQPRQ